MTTPDGNWRAERGASDAPERDRSRRFDTLAGRHRFDDRPRRCGRRIPVRVPHESSASRSSNRRSTITASTCSRRSSPSPRSSTRRTSTACLRSSRAVSRTDASTAADRVMPRASSPRRSRPPICSAVKARPASACCSSSARSAGAKARSGRTSTLAAAGTWSTGSRPTGGSAWRRAASSACVLKAKGRAAHSSFPELGESAIDKLIDVLMELRRVEWPSDPLLGRTHYTVGLISGGVAPNVVPPVGAGGVDVPHRQRRLAASWTSSGGFEPRVVDRADPRGPARHG